MTTIILYVDLALNGDRMDSAMIQRLSEGRSHLITKQQPEQLTVLDRYLDKGFTAIFTGQIVYEGDHRRLDKAIFILYAPDASIGGPVS